MDTQKITSELLATGLKQHELADLIPCSQSLISALLRGERGSRLSFQIGQRLLALHKRRCTKRKPDSLKEAA
jgi:predicted transcriptional regulator